MSNEIVMEREMVNGEAYSRCKTGYYIFLSGLRMPITPSKITRKVQNRNETIDLVNGEEFNVRKPAGLTEYEFSLLLPHQEYPFARYDEGFLTPAYFLSFFEGLKSEKAAFEFSGYRFSANQADKMYQFCQTVTLEDYKIIEDAENGDDIEVEIKLKEFNDQKTLKFTIDSAGVLTKQVR